MKGIGAISVIGLGKLGLCSAACFADKGYKVIGVDLDLEKVDKINKGISPIRETGLAQLLKKARKNLKATLDLDEAVLNSDVSFIVVTTPSLADGGFSSEYLEETANRIGLSLSKKRAYHLVVVVSTVMPNTIERVVKFILEKVSGKSCGKDLGIVYNPEFIALGSVIHDFLNPDMVLIGEEHKKDGDILEEIYKKTCENKPRFARMSLINAEIAKIALNCYITTKITFVNSLASICERVKGADAYVISNALGLDSRIGSKYMKPGLGYGGPCFPRDNVAFAAFARRVEREARLARVVDEVNREQAARVVNKIKDILVSLNKDRENARIAILGLAYKPNTPVIEDSQALSITQTLANEGYHISVYDPEAGEDARSILGDRVRYAKNKEDCVRGVDLAVIAVPWPEFKKINLKRINKNAILLDCWMLLKGRKGINIKYLGVG